MYSQYKPISAHSLEQTTAKILTIPIREPLPAKFIPLCPTAPVVPVREPLPAAFVPSLKATSPEFIPSKSSPFLTPHQLKQSEVLRTMIERENEPIDRRIKHELKINQRTLGKMRGLDNAIKHLDQKLDSVADFAEDIAEETMIIVDEQQSLFNMEEGTVEAESVEHLKPDEWILVTRDYIKKHKRTLINNYYDQTKSYIVNPGQEEKLDKLLLHLGPMSKALMEMKKTETQGKLDKTLSGKSGDDRANARKEFFAKEKEARRERKQKRKDIANQKIEEMIDDDSLDWRNLATAVKLLALQPSAVNLSDLMKKQRITKLNHDYLLSCVLDLNPFIKDQQNREPYLFIQSLWGVAHKDANALTKAYNGNTADYLRSEVIFRSDGGLTPGLYQNTPIYTNATTHVQKWTKLSIATDVFAAGVPGVDGYMDMVLQICNEGVSPINFPVSTFLNDDSRRWVAMHKLLAKAGIALNYTIDNYNSTVDIVIPSRATIYVSTHAPLLTGIISIAWSSYFTMSGANLTPFDSIITIYINGKQMRGTAYTMRKKLIDLENAGLLLKVRGKYSKAADIILSDFTIISAGSGLNGGMNPEPAQVGAVDSLIPGNSGPQLAVTDPPKAITQDIPNSTPESSATGTASMRIILDKYLQCHTAVNDAMFGAISLDMNNANTQFTSNFKTEQTLTDNKSFTISNRFYEDCWSTCTAAVDDSIFDGLTEKVNWGTITDPLTRKKKKVVSRLNSDEMQDAFDKIMAETEELPDDFIDPHPECMVAALLWEFPEIITSIIRTRKLRHKHLMRWVERVGNAVLTDMTTPGFTDSHAKLVAAFHLPTYNVVEVIEEDGTVTSNIEEVNRLYTEYMQDFLPTYVEHAIQPAIERWFNDSYERFKVSKEFQDIKILRVKNELGIHKETVGDQALIQATAIRICPWQDINTNSVDSALGASYAALYTAINAAKPDIVTASQYIRINTSLCNGDAMSRVIAVDGPKYTSGNVGSFAPNLIRLQLYKLQYTRMPGVGTSLTIGNQHLRLSNTPPIDFTQTSFQRPRAPFRQNPLLVMPARIIDSNTFTNLRAGTANDIVLPPDWSMTTWGGKTALIPVTMSQTNQPEVNVPWTLSFFDYPYKTMAHQVRPVNDANQETWPVDIEMMTAAATAANITQQPEQVLFVLVNSFLKPNTDIILQFGPPGFRTDLSLAANGLAGVSVDLIDALDGWFETPTIDATQNKLNNLQVATNWWDKHFGNDIDFYTAQTVVACVSHYLGPPNLQTDDGSGRGFINNRLANPPEWNYYGYQGFPDSAFRSYRQSSSTPHGLWIVTGITNDIIRARLLSGAYTTVGRLDPIAACDAMWGVLTFSSTYQPAGTCFALAARNKMLASTITDLYDNFMKLTGIPWNVLTRVNQSQASAGMSGLVRQQIVVATGKFLAALKVICPKMILSLRPDACLQTDYADWTWWPDLGYGFDLDDSLICYGRKPASAQMDMGMFFEVPNSYRIPKLDTNYAITALLGIINIETTTYQAIDPYVAKSFWSYMMSLITVTKTPVEATAPRATPKIALTTKNTSFYRTMAFPVVSPSASISLALQYFNYGALDAKGFKTVDPVMFGHMPTIDPNSGMQLVMLFQFDSKYYGRVTRAPMMDYSLRLHVLDDVAYETVLQTDNYGILEAFAERQRLMGFPVPK